MHPIALAIERDPAVSSGGIRQGASPAVNLRRVLIGTERGPACGAIGGRSRAGRTETDPADVRRPCITGQIARCVNGNAVWIENVALTVYVIYGYPANVRRPCPPLKNIVGVGARPERNRQHGDGDHDFNRFL